MNGSLSLVFALRGERTRPIRALAVPPIQCSPVRYDDANQPSTACMTLLHLGGVLQGDQLALDIAVESGAARLTTAAATQIYTMPERNAAQTLALTACPNTQLFFLPEPTILFAGSRFSQTTHVTLHPGAALVLRDIVVGGRLARGEVHTYDYFRSALEVCDEHGRCLVAERGRVEPSLRSPDTLGVQFAAPVVGSLYLLLRGRDSEAMLTQLWQATRDASGAHVGVGMLPNQCGILVRALGASVPPVRAVLDTAICAWSGSYQS